MIKVCETTCQRSGIGDDCTLSPVVFRTGHVQLNYQMADSVHLQLPYTDVFVSNSLSVVAARFDRVQKGLTSSWRKEKPSITISEDTIFISGGSRELLEADNKGSIVECVSRDFHFLG